ncbi:MAG: hypothetical protein Q8916_02035 [Bacteroidota bacterium]|nr:hypothetical protein [Bacteroidota bacterium]MDP4229167.1 hypothetical protein [Bacteroidota bacterium]
MKSRLSLIFLVLLLIPLGLSAQELAQTQGSFSRTIGARAFECDDGAGKTMTWDLSGPLDASYFIHWPTGLPDGLSFCAVDPAGYMWWSEYLPLPPLAPGNIWVGNDLSVATPMAPGPVGAVLTVNSLSMPSWSLTIPGPVTISASQITSGTIQPGVTINVGAGGTIQPAGGTVIANGLVGSGPNKFTGNMPIPPGVPNLFVPYTAIMANASVLVSIVDPNAAVFTVLPTVTSVAPGSGFTVEFSAPYPNPAGTLHYMVVNP